MVAAEARQAALEAGENYERQVQRPTYNGTTAAVLEYVTLEEAR
jgi:hypothetical protein